MNRKEHKEHQDRKWFSLHGLHTFPIAFFANFAVQLPASQGLSTGVFVIRVPRARLWHDQRPGHFAVQESGQ
jgi:hypothetical protein